MGRSRFFPPDDVTVGEWHYLRGRYPADEAEDRRIRIGQTLKRLVRKGHHPERLHLALMLGTQSWEGHAQRQKTRRTAPRLNAAKARARRDVDRMLASLRRLAPPGFAADDDELFSLRGILLEPVAVPPKRPRGGRPWDWKQDAEQALRQCGVGASDRRELSAALGFVEHE